MSIRQVSGPTLGEMQRQIRALGGGRAAQNAMGVLGRVLTDAQRQAFAQQASPAGVPWQAVRTARPGRILHRSGALERAATRPVFRGNTLAFLLPIYGARQQFGWPGGLGPGQAPTPARPFMALDPLPFSVQQRLTREINVMLAQQLR